MISAGEFRNGVTFEMDGKVMQVVEFQHVKPGKGAAFVRTKMKNVITGAVTETSFNPTAKFPTAYVERKKLEYSYNDGGLYYFMAREILDAKADGRKEGLKAMLQNGLDTGFRFYDPKPEYTKELVHFVRLRDLDDFGTASRNEIRSSGYVVDSIEAAVWCLLTNDSYEECELAAVNLGSDTDTVAAIAGGLAGLYYTARRIPTEWLDVIARKEWILELCRKAANA